MINCKKPFGISSGYKLGRKWNWKSVKWEKCYICGLWHSNRMIPREFWNQEWNIIAGHKRQKAGIILIRDSKEFWITQSYNKCYGFPKGEREIDEDLQTCAKREFYEETGFNIDNINLDRCKTLRTFIENVEYVYYIINVNCEFNIVTFPIDDVEITSFGWVSYKDINKLYLSKAVRRILYKLFYLQSLNND